MEVLETLTKKILLPARKINQAKLDEDFTGSSVNFWQQQNVYAVRQTWLLLLTVSFIYDFRVLSLHSLVFDF